ncbi:MAG: GNAT family N-acetyltransferase [Canibacter sp.]
MTLDATSFEKLAASGLEYREINPDDHAAIDAHYRSTIRGFIDAEPRAEVLAANRARQAETQQRSIGIFDAQSEQVDLPIATIASWMTQMTVPGGDIPLWAISELTVSATHRRRGIARAMVEGELRDAAKAGVAVAGLTVSEATIYSRYGFGPASWLSELTVDARRAGWRAGEVAGSFQYVSLERLAEYLYEIADRSRPQQIGTVHTSRQVYRQVAGIGARPDHKDEMRGVVYFDEQGDARGAIQYRVHTDGDWSRSELIGNVTAETPAAHAALWQFALQHDLIGTVKMEKCAIDDSISWLVKDRRAISTKIEDDHWLRILDTKTALESRRYRAPLSITLWVHDDLGFASGSWQFSTQKVDNTEYGYAATLSELDDEDQVDTENSVFLDVSELASLYLGGVAVGELVDAGRIEGSNASLQALDLALRAAREPFLRVGY